MKFSFSFFYRFKKKRHHYILAFWPRGGGCTKSRLRDKKRDKAKLVRIVCWSTFPADTLYENWYVFLADLHCVSIRISRRSTFLPDLHCLSDLQCLSDLHCPSPPQIKMIRNVCWSGDPHCKNINEIHIVKAGNKLGWSVLLRLELAEKDAW